MIAKIETSNLENKYFDFFSLIQKEIFVKTPPYINSIKEIVSSMVLSKIVELDISRNKILTTIEVKVKIVCLSQDNNLHMIEDVTLFYREIEVDKKIEGINIVDFFRSKRLDINIFVLDSEVSIIDNQKFYIDIQLVLSIDYKRGFTLAMLMRTSDLEKNIYICLESGKDIRQITFEENEEFKLIKWVSGKNIVSYVKNEFDNDVLYFYSIAENLETEVLTMVSKIYSYTYISNQRIVIDCEYEGERNLYIYNLKFERISKMIKNIKNKELRMPVYRDDIDRIFFIKKNSERYQLCSIKSDITDFEELTIISEKKYFTKDGFDFVIIFEIENILLYQIESKRQIKVKYPFGNSGDLKGYSISGKKNTFAVAMDLGSEILFYIYENRSKKFKSIKVDRRINEISGMCFNDRGTHIMVSIEVMGVYNLYKISMDGKCEEILALYSDELELFEK